MSGDQLQDGRGPKLAPPHRDIGPTEQGGGGNAALQVGNAVLVITYLVLLS